MRKSKLTILCYLLIMLFFILAQLAYADGVTLEPVADTHIEFHENWVDENYGNDSIIQVLYQPAPVNAREQIFIKFDLSEIPGDSTVTNATLRLYVDSSIGNELVSLAVLPVSDEWEELEITANNKPSVADSPVSEAAIPTSVNGYFNWSVTDLVRGWVNGDYPNYGLSITTKEDPESWYQRTFSSREGVYKPLLTIEYTSPTSSSQTLLKITDVKVEKVTDKAVTITWATSKDANSFVEYGTTKDYGLTKSDSENTTAHSVKIGGLKPDKQYHFRVKSKDESGDEQISEDIVFKTKQKDSSEERKDDLQRILIIGLVVLIDIITAGIVIAYFLYQKKKRKGEPGTDKDSLT